MQIINKKDCYVSKDDLIHLYDQDETMPLSLQLGLRDALVNDKDYIKITEDKGLEYIYTSDIPSFENLRKLKIKELRNKINQIILDDMLNDNKGRDLSLEEILLEKKNREYMIRQLKEMIAFKKRISKIKYPNIPLPNEIQISNGLLNAALSYNLNSIVIYNLNGSKVENINDIEFCKNAFKQLVQKENDDLNLEMKYEDNYLVVKNKPIIRRLLKRKEHVN